MENTQKRTLQFSLLRSADDPIGKAKRSTNGDTSDPRHSREIDKHYVGHRATNPFIIFYLRLRSKKPKEPVTVIARAAGKLWSRMSPEQKKRYIDLANAEKKRREGRRRKRKHNPYSRRH
ncbi:hypothetical protein KM043_011580 [Ampulex compressa]|nr:hypothetical protein KM043_011580 [Ampulex compressa]